MKRYTSREQVVRYKIRSTAYRPCRNGAPNLGNVCGNDHPLIIIYKFTFKHHTLSHTHRRILCIIFNE